MVISMTGFATRSFVITNKQNVSSTITLSIKSLNGRFLEAVCKLPPSFSLLETALIKIFKQKLQRGTLVFSVQLSNPHILKEELLPDFSFIQRYIESLQTIQKKYSIPGTLTISDLAQHNEFFMLEERPLDECIKKLFFQEVDFVLDDLQAMRQQEGAALAQDLMQRFTALIEKIHAIEQRAKIVVQEQQKIIAQKISILEQNPNELTETQKTALFLELKKIDIHEEIVRFKDHVEKFIHHIKTDEQEKGRRLDFILQELSREINTIAAKSSDTQLSNAAISIKVELEKAREQVQNIV